ncbi:hypothetical protein ATANTOWER_026164 [Ataeniobius toweri]|uniref:Uncharacterized protein n=1 Tax=Ataeniobius toweri TaxID=208326 RepID=A0ABU7B9Z3_9TELE|nr:hypothetical protein [Ataeniobius toweri]
MYYLGMKPTADKRLYCTVLREPFNSLASGQLGTKLFGQQQINLSTLLGLLPDSIGQGERRAWPKSCSQAPALVQGGLLAYTLLSVSLVPQAKERGLDARFPLLPAKLSVLKAEVVD